MNNSLNRTLIETTVRNSIKQIKQDPERSMRNLIDMAVSFSNGRFQKYFLESAQTMLKKETSCYYKIIPDLVANADTERIVTVGMNIGYNSCTLGARKIREIEAKEQFNIPWSISLEMSYDSYHKNIAHYLSLLPQGKEMGIYTWNIHTLDNPAFILEFAEIHPECTFLIFCSPEHIIPALLDDAKNIYNIIFIIEYNDTTAEACSLLRSHDFLYSVYYSQNNTEPDIGLLDEILSDTENLNSVFTVFFLQNSSLEESKPFYDCITKIRAEQSYHSIPFDFLQDSCYIDSIISDQPCAIGFTKDGNCYSFIKQMILPDCNIFQNHLHSILQIASSIH